MISYAVYRFILKYPYMNVFLELEYGCAKTKELVKKIGMAHSQLSIVLQAMEREKLITRFKEKNAFDVELTDKGRALCKAFKQIKDIVENWDDKQEEKEAIVPDESLCCKNNETGCLVDLCTCNCAGCEQERNNGEK